MVRRGAALVAVAIGLFRDPGCGGSGDVESGPNAPCTRSKDCLSGLVCEKGVCTDPDASSASEDAPMDAGRAPTEASAPRDASPNLDAADDGG